MKLWLVVLLWFVVSGTSVSSDFEDVAMETLETSLSSDSLVKMLLHGDSSEDVVARWPPRGGCCRRGRCRCDSSESSLSFPIFEETFGSEETSISESAESSLSFPDSDSSEMSWEDAIGGKRRRRKPKKKKAKKTCTLNGWKKLWMSKKKTKACKPLHNRNKRPNDKQICGCYKSFTKKQVTPFNCGMKMGRHTYNPYTAWNHCQNPGKSNKRRIDPMAHLRDAVRKACAGKKRKSSACKKAKTNYSNSYNKLITMSRACKKKRTSAKCKKATKAFFVAANFNPVTGKPGKPGAQPEKKNCKKTKSKKSCKCGWKSRYSGTTGCTTITCISCKKTKRKKCPKTINPRKCKCGVRGKTDRNKCRSYTCVKCPKKGACKKSSSSKCKCGWRSKTKNGCTTYKCIKCLSRKALMKLCKKAKKPKGCKCGIMSRITHKSCKHSCRKCKKKRKDELGFSMDMTDSDELSISDDMEDSFDEVSISDDMEDSFDEVSISDDMEDSFDEVSISDDPIRLSARPGGRLI